MFDTLFPARRKADRAEGELANLSDMPRFAEEFFRSPFSAMRGMHAMPPAIDIAEDDDNVVVTAELPGLDPKDVDISVERSMLTITGEKKMEREEEKERYVYSERSYGSFRRSVSLPSAVETDAAKAAFKDGVLTVTLPKDAAAKPKRIQVTN